MAGPVSDAAHGLPVSVITERLQTKKSKAIRNAMPDVFSSPYSFVLVAVDPDG